MVFYFTLIELPQIKNYVNCVSIVVKAVPTQVPQLLTGLIGNDMQLVLCHYHCSGISAKSFFDFCF
jgi:hypothetical protein